MTKYNGIDLSLFQGEVDFTRVKADGMEFVMIKASQGRTAEYDSPFTDPRYHEYRRGAGQAGLYHGCYHYLCARNMAEARAEAEYFVDLVKPYKDEMKLWCAVDVEDETFLGHLPKDELTAIVDDFCRTVKAAGLRPMVYASTWWLDNRFDTPKGVPVWEANLSTYTHPKRAKIWQYSFTGRVDGIGGAVDLNRGIDIIGDANGDGRVNLKDVALTLKAAAGWRGTGIDEGQADVNDDGYVTAADAAAILRRVAGRKEVK